MTAAAAVLLDRLAVDDADRQRDELREAVVVTVSGLPDDQERETVLIKYGLNGSDPMGDLAVGRIVGRDERTVRKRVQRAFEQMRPVLADLM